MLEYVFFDPCPRQRFVDFLRARGIRVDELDDDDVCGVAIPKDKDDELMDEIEACYPEELDEVVNAIVGAVENPDSRTLCQALKDDG